MIQRESFYQSVYGVVREIPRGKVATYGQIAAILGHPRAARAVGYALHSLRGSQIEDVPWQRVINAQGTISAKGDVIRAEMQRRLLQDEGVVFGAGEKVSLEIYRWEGPEVFLNIDIRVDRGG